MDIENILRHCDHTELKQIATIDDIKALIDDAIKYNTASVCIPPCYVKEAVEYANGKMPICTVIGFPNGYNSTEIKLIETKEALLKGAEEIDMVINVGMLKAGNTDYVLNEIKTLKAACGNKILKVIIETCLLTDEEKITMCKLVTEAGADYIKTSTGFSTGGATVEAVKLMRETVGPEMGVKASGGVRTHEDLIAMVEAGANRIGTSSGAKII